MVYLTYLEQEVFNDDGSSRIDEQEEQINDLALKTDEKLSELSSDTRELSSLNGKYSTEKADFEITDEFFKVILRLANGHIKTKNFNSEETATFEDIKVTVNEDGCDFSIGDNRYKIVKVEEGHIVTRNFNSKFCCDNEYENGIISVIGDSISSFGDFINIDNTDTTNQRTSSGKWCYQGNLCRYPQRDLGILDVGQMYWHRVMTRLNMVYGVNDSIRGSRVSWDGVTENGTNIGADKHIASLTRINHLGENGEPKLILVYAGTNDIIQNVPIGTFDTSDVRNYSEEEIRTMNVSTFANAYKALIVRLLNKYKNSKIVCIMPNLASSYTTQHLDNYIEMIRTICDHFGIGYIDLRTCGISIYNKANYLNDNTHPNSNGHDMIYKKVFNYLITQ